MIRLAPATLCLIAIVLCSTTTSSAQVGGTFVLSEHEEAGSMYDPDDGTVVRAVTALSPDHVIYEERNFFGQALGVLRRAGDLSAAPPTVTTRSSGPVLFAADGISPFSDPTTFHPTTFEIGGGSSLVGLYTVSDAPTGPIEFFTSIAGSLWTHAGTPSSLAAIGGEGVVDVLRVEDGAHAEGEAVIVYYQTATGAVRAIVSSIVATGVDKFVDLDPTTDVEILSATAVSGGFAATGAIFSFPSGDCGFFFIPRDGTFIGFAETLDPLTGWSVTRGASDPLLSTSANLAAVDLGRSEVLELTLFPVGIGFEGYYTGAIPGFPNFTRCLGGVRFESPNAFDTSVAFIRGDANSNGLIDFVDAIFVLQYLFSGGASPGCLDAADDNDDGVLNILDPVRLLEYFFSGGSPPPPPFTACAKDPTYDPLSCESFPCIP